MLLWQWWSLDTMEFTVGTMGLVFSVRGWDCSFTPPRVPQSSIADWLLDEIPFQPESGFLGHRSH